MDVFLCYLQYYFSGRQFQHQITLFSRKGFRLYVSEATSLWEEMATDRLLWGAGPLHVLHYEHLLADPARHLLECLQFLG